MRRTYEIRSEWLERLLSELEERSMTLQEIHDLLAENQYEIPIGELRSILSAFSFLGLIKRKKTWKKNYRYQIEKTEKFEKP